MSARFKKRKSKSLSKAGPLALIAGLVVVILTIGGGFGWLLMRANEANVPVNQDTLCPLTGPLAQTIVLVDATDSISPLARKEIVQRLNELMRDTSKGALFEVRVLSGGADKGRIAGSRCNPGTGANADEWTSNPRKMQQTWDDKFGPPLTAAFEDSLKQTAADQSPIMAALQEISVDRFTAKAMRLIKSRIVVISDLLEHTADFSLYRSPPTMEAYLASSAARRFRSDFAEAGVELWVLDRGKVDTNALVDFWTAWFGLYDGGVDHAIHVL